jgi:hypothetical protein
MFAPELDLLLAGARRDGWRRGLSGDGRDRRRHGLGPRLLELLEPFLKPSHLLLQRLDLRGGARLCSGRRRVSSLQCEHGDE